MRGGGIETKRETKGEREKLEREDKEMEREMVREGIKREKEKKKIYDKGSICNLVFVCWMS